MTGREAAEGRHTARVVEDDEDIAGSLGRGPTRVGCQLERAWDANRYRPTKVLDMHMAALRRKLGVPGLIETVYGHGFRLAAKG